MARLGKIVSGALKGPRTLMTDRLFPRLFASLDFSRGSRQVPPLNGQRGRTAIVEAIIRSCGVAQIVETGTYRGASTAWFAAFGVPVYTVESNARFAHLARLNFAGTPSVHTAEMDWVAFLEQLAHDPQRTAPLTLFYLDAHWNKRLPLGEEVQIVAGAFPSAIMVIDDFCVPDDPDYGFDDYGPDKRLDVAYLKRTGVPGLTGFFPRFAEHRKTAPGAAASWSPRTPTLARASPASTCCARPRSSSRRPCMDATSVARYPMKYAMKHIHSPDVLYEMVWRQATLARTSGWLQDDRARLIGGMIAEQGASKSQICQDIWVRPETAGKREGFFVEFGATDGISLSNTFLLEQNYGWTGILAEPIRHGTRNSVAIGRMLPLRPNVSGRGLVRRCRSLIPPIANSARSEPLRPPIAMARPAASIRPLRCRRSL